MFISKITEAMMNLAEKVDVQAVHDGTHSLADGGFALIAALGKMLKPIALALDILLIIGIIMIIGGLIATMIDKKKRKRNRKNKRNRKGSKK